MASRIGMDEKEMPVTGIHALSFTEEIAAIGEEFRFRRNLLAEKEYACEGQTNCDKQVERETETSGGDSEGKGEWLSRSDHPLRNPLILEKVFENVKLKKDLKECRVVSKIWNHLMIPFVRPEVTVTIYGNQSQHETHRIDQFVEDFSTNSLGIPIENFKLEAVGTTDVHGKEFLKLCWETAKSIEFDDKFDNEVCYMIEDLSELLKSSQKLEYLRLDVNMSSKSGDVIKLFPENSKPSLSCLKKLDMHRLLISSPPTQSKERRKCCPTFIEKLLEIAPNVSHITSSGWSNEIEESGCSLKDILTAIGNLGREASIKTLVCNTVTKEDIETMQGMTEKLNGLRLKTLEFEFVRSEGDYGGFFSAQVQLITTLRDSLEHLDMWEAVFDSFFQLPRMSRLKSLVIGISEDFNSRGVDLNQIFPTLKTLRLACRDDNPTFDEFLSESEPFLTLKSFQCNPGSLYLSLNAFTQILKVFPKLTSLCLDIKEPHGVKILNQIWTNMPQLELLAIAFLHPMREVESLDSVFTGISFQTLEDIKHIVNSQIMGEMTPKLRRDTISNLKIQHCHLPSIGNLTNLRYLEIIDWSDDGTDLTDLTGYLGLYLMPGLKHVKIDGCKFTEAALDLLKVDLGLETCSLA